jgi:hypothetical protein
MLVSATRTLPVIPAKAGIHSHDIQRKSTASAAHPILHRQRL